MATSSNIRTAKAMATHSSLVVFLLVLGLAAMRPSSQEAYNINSKRVGSNVTHDLCTILLTT
jgi:hypothetical protein